MIKDMVQELVSIVCPVYNEEEVIGLFVKRVIDSIKPLDSEYSFEVILVDDGSFDSSLNKMKEIASFDNRIKIIELCRNYGQTAALQAGIDEAKGDIIITMDSDLQHFPEEIPVFISRLDEGYDMVCGWREKRAESIFRRWPSSMANYLIKRITKLRVHDFGTTFRAYRKNFIKDIRLFGEFHRFIPALGNILGARITEIPIQNIDRPKGKSNYGIGRTFGVFLDLILLFFFSRYMDRPIRIFGKVAAPLFIFGFAILCVILVYAYTYNIHAVVEHQGWFILGIVSILFAGHIVMTGILAEILIRIHYAQGDRRVYRIRNKWNYKSIVD